jgi:hypothetical protein
MVYYLRRCRLLNLTLVLIPNTFYLVSKNCGSMPLLNQHMVDKVKARKPATRYE